MAPSSGALSGWIWAPDIRYYDGAWYMYFSASPNTATFNQRLYWIRNTCANPTTCAWSAPQRFTTGWESFQLDAASFVNRGVRYFVWAQDSPNTNYNSHMYIARMNGATGITGTVTEIARPTYGWEMEGVAGVVEGPSPLVKNGKVFIAYSASATDSRYKLGLLSAPDTADLLNPSSWSKRANPVFQTANGVYGPGHGSFTVAEDNTTDMLVYHARDYATPTPDALTDPNRHTRMQQLYWQENGDPFFGQPIPSSVAAPGIRGRHSNRCVDNYNFDKTPGALVRLYDCSGNTAQEFEFTYPGANGYEIRNRNTGTCLDDLNGSTAANADVGLYPCNGLTTQRWTDPGPWHRVVLPAQRRRQHVPGQLQLGRRERRPPLPLPVQRPERPAVAARLDAISPRPCPSRAAPSSARTPRRGSGPPARTAARGPRPASDRSGPG